jgi:hypothetical protein
VSGLRCWTFGFWDTRTGWFAAWLPGCLAAVLDPLTKPHIFTTQLCSTSIPTHRRYVFDDAAAAEAAPSSERYVVAKNEAAAREKAVGLYGEGVVLKQESDVLDTWFSSGLWPFSTLGWPAATPDLER